MSSEWSCVCVCVGVKHNSPLPTCRPLDTSGFVRLRCAFLSLGGVVILLVYIELLHLRRLYNRYSPFHDKSLRIYCIEITIEDNYLKLHCVTFWLMHRGGLTEEEKMGNCLGPQIYRGAPNQLLTPHSAKDWSLYPFNFCPFFFFFFSNLIHNYNLQTKTAGSHHPKCQECYKKKRIYVFCILTYTFLSPIYKSLLWKKNRFEGPPC